MVKSTPYTLHPTPHRKLGFTLVEVMVATAVLSLGTVLIYEIFFKAIDISDYCRNYLSVASQVDERIWQAQNDLSRFNAIVTPYNNNWFADTKKNFSWDLSYQLIDKDYGLYRVDGILSWQQGKRRRSISRTAYALYVEKK